MSRLLSRRELPPWVTALAGGPALFAVFCLLRPGWIREYTFALNKAGAVRFEELAEHTKHATAISTEPVVHVPPEVLIQAGVEAMRRRGGAR